MRHCDITTFYGYNRNINTQEPLLSPNSNLKCHDYESLEAAESNTKCTVYQHTETDRERERGKEKRNNKRAGYVFTISHFRVCCAVLYAMCLFSAMLVTYINYNIIILYEWGSRAIVSMDAMGLMARHCNSNGNMLLNLVAR